MKSKFSKLRNVPFWMYVMSPYSAAPRGLFASRTVPESVTDTKDITYNDVQIPGGATSISKYGGMGIRTVSFAIKLVNMDDKLGVTSYVNVFDLIRQPDWYNGAFSMASPKNSFVPNCRVFMHHSMIVTVPQIFKVRKCDYTTSNPNRLGRPQVCDISLDLIMDETSAVYTAERLWSFASGILGGVKSIRSTLGQGSNPYKRGSLV